MTISKRVCGIAKVCLRCNLPPHLLISALLLAVSLFVMAPSYWEASESTSFLEILAAPMDLILLTPLFLPEQDETILDILKVRSTPVSLIYAVRATCALLFAFLFPIIFIAALRLLHCETAPGVWASVVSSGLFLGGLGAFAFALWGNIAAAYMVPVLYDMLCLFTGPHKFKEWGLEAVYLFSTGGSAPAFKPLLFLFGLALLSASIPLRCRRSSRA